MQGSSCPAPPPSPQRQAASMPAREPEHDQERPERKSPRGPRSGAGILPHLRVRACPSWTGSDVSDICHVWRTAAARQWYVSWSVTCSREIRDMSCVRKQRNHVRSFFRSLVFRPWSSFNYILSSESSVWKSCITALIDGPQIHNHLG